MTDQSDQGRAGRVLFTTKEPASLEPRICAACGAVHSVDHDSFDWVDVYVWVIPVECRNGCGALSNHELDAPQRDAARP